MPSTSSKRRGVASTETRIALPSWVPSDAFHAWVEMRRRIRKPLTDYAVGLAIKRLAELSGSGEDPGAVLDQSTMRGWSGLFAVRNDESGGGAARDGKNPVSALEKMRRGR